LDQQSLQALIARGLINRQQIAGAAGASSGEAPVSPVSSLYSMGRYPNYQYYMNAANQVANTQGRQDVGQ